MFDTFESHFTRDPFTPKPAGPWELTTQSVPELREYFLRYGGLSFNSGLYRVMDPSILPEAAEVVALAFPELAKVAKCFAYDWLGAIFALDIGRVTRGEPEILILDLDRDHALEIPFGLASFHDVALVNERDAMLQSKMHDDWLATGGPIPKPNECIGHQVPLFLGGVDAIGNLKKIYLSVQWYITAQIIDRVRDLPVGTKIGKFSISD